MSRKYSTWALNQPLSNSDSMTMKLATVVGNEQDQLKNIERVEAVPHTYINVDAPPPPIPVVTTINNDAKVTVPSVNLSRQNSSYFAAPVIPSTPTNAQTKLWPVEKSSKNPSIIESTSAASKSPRKHRHHHHHHHHNGKHHHHRHHHHHHQQKHRAKSAESIRNRPNQVVVPASKMIMTNPQYIEQNSQQQPMIIYREAPNGEGYTFDPNGIATVPYETQNATALVDDQQAPVFVYHDSSLQQQQQQQPTIVTDGLSQQPVFLRQDQEAIFQQSDPSMYLPQQSPQIVYCADPNQPDLFCSPSTKNFVQQCISSPLQQPQIVCLDNMQTAMQPTMINQIPIFNPLTPNTTMPSIVTVPQTQLQHAANVITHQPQPLQLIQQNPPLQVIQPSQSLQVIPQPQPLQIIQSPSSQTGQFVQLASVAPQVIQAAPVLQTIQVPTQTIAVLPNPNPQILYQRPYDPILAQVQNQAVAIENPSLALSQPSYAPARVVSAAQATSTDGANMFREALIRTVAGRSGVPIPPSVSAGTGGLQLTQPSGTASVSTITNSLVIDSMESKAPLLIVPLTPGAVVVPIESSQNSGLSSSCSLPRTTDFRSRLHNFNDIRTHIEDKRSRLEKILKQRVDEAQIIQLRKSSEARSLPVTTATSRSTTTPYTPGNTYITGTGLSGPSTMPSTYSQLPAAAPNYSQLPRVAPTYSQPSYIGSTTGSVLSGPTTGPYYSLRS